MTVLRRESWDHPSGLGDSCYKDGLENEVVYKISSKYSKRYFRSIGNINSTYKSKVLSLAAGQGALEKTESN